MRAGARRCANEHRYIVGKSARWRFSLGCTRAASLIRLRTTAGRPAPGTAGSRGCVLAGIIGAVCLAGYGLLHYPGLRSGPGTWISVTCFLLVLVSYALVALALSGQDMCHASIASRHGVIGGLLIGSAWFLILAPTSLVKSWVALPLLIALVGPACIAALASRSANDAKTGAQAALWSGIVGGLAAFLIWVSATYLRDGRPYDPGLVRDFHQSGAPDLATYAVSDNLGSGLVLLIIVPIVAIALGSVTARLTAGSVQRPRLD
jgi:hypothetical protein